MLEIKNLYVNIGNLSIIQDVSLKVGNGEIVALIGANGMGKTTLVRAISKLNNIKSGKILLDGEDITDLSADKIVEKGIIQVPEGRKLFPQMSVRENIEMGAYAKRARAKEKENLEYVFSVFPELVSMQKQACGNLSGGQQQMVAIARSIMASPELLLLDEVMAGLTPTESQEMVELIRDVKEKGVTILMIEHIMPVIMALSDTVYVLESGRLICKGTPEEVSQNTQVIESYLGRSQEA